jgi:hypothetical protein
MPNHGGRYYPSIQPPAQSDTEVLHLSHFKYKHNCGNDFCNMLNTVPRLCRSPAPRARHDKATPAILFKPVHCRNVTSVLRCCMCSCVLCRDAICPRDLCGLCIPLSCLFNSFNLHLWAENLAQGKCRHNLDLFLPRACC